MYICLSIYLSLSLSISLSLYIYIYIYTYTIVIGAAVDVVMGFGLQWSPTQNSMRPYPSAVHA